MINEVGGQTYSTQGPVSASSSGSPWFANINKKSNVRYWVVNVLPSRNLNTRWELYVSCPGSPIQQPQSSALGSSQPEAVF